MHRLRFIFGHKRRTDSKSSRRDRGAAPAKTKPVLKRCNALKNIDFQPTQEFYASVEWNDKKSFRIEGDDGKIESIFRELGLSGPDDFEIPVAAWVAMKVSSSWYDLPGLCNSPDCVRVTDGRFPVNDEPDSCKVTRFPASGVIDLKIEANDSEISEVCGENHRHVDCVCSGSGAVLKGEMCETANRVSDSVSLNINDVTFNKAGGGGGIKGVRPPVLVPPPAMSFTVANDTHLAWNMPEDETKLRFVPPKDAKVANKEGANTEVDADVENHITQIGFNELHSASCSFTTISSDDDDSSSTAMELMTTISPNGRFKRIMTGWQKGQLLGRGSFGSVYEGIADGGFFFAVKEVSLLDQGDGGRQSIYQLEQEIALLSQFEHENIVQYFGTDKDARIPKLMSLIHCRSQARIKEGCGKVGFESKILSHL